MACTLGNGGDSIARFPKKGKGFKGEGNPTYWAELCVKRMRHVACKHHVTQASCCKQESLPRTSLHPHYAFPTLHFTHTTLSPHSPQRFGCSYNGSKDAQGKFMPQGQIEMELACLTQDDADIRPVGSGRDDPNRFGGGRGGIIQTGLVGGGRGVYTAVPDIPALNPLHYNPKPLIFRRSTPLQRPRDAST